MSKKKMFILIGCIGGVIVIGLSVLLIVLFTSNFSLKEVYEKKAESLAEAGLYASLIEQVDEVDEYTQKFSISGSVRAILRFEGDLMIAFEFDTAKAAKAVGVGRQERNLVFISDYADMTDLLYGKLSAGNGDYFFTSDKSKRVTLVKGVTGLTNGVDYVGYRAFASSDISEVTISATVKEILPYAFFNCKSLREVHLYDSDALQKISDYAFFNCVAIEELHFNVGVKEVGAYAFLNCQSLESLVFFGELTAIYEGALMGCDSLIDIKVGGSYTIEDSGLYTHDKSELVRYLGRDKEVSLPNSVKKIGVGAFERNSSLQKISAISVEEIGDYAFESCWRLVAADLFSVVTEIGKNVFFNTPLKNIELSERLLNIGENAFRGTRIDRLTLPSSIKNIGDKAFYDCIRLRYIFAPNSFAIGEAVFNGIYRIFTPNASEVKEDMEEYSDYIYPVSALQGDYAIMDVLNGVEVVQYLGKNEDIIVPKTIAGKTVISIGDRAFADLSFPKTIAFEGSGVNEIKSSAFEQIGSLTSLQFPDGVTTFMENSVKNCPKLESLRIPASVTRIERYAFDMTKWLSLKSGFIMVGDNILYRYKGNDKSVTLPANCKQVGDRAFSENANVFAIITNPALKKINAYAFSGCKSLVDITLFEGLEEIHSAAFGGCIAMRQITLPSTVFYIGYGAFYKLYLDTIILKMPKPINIGGDLFAYPQGKSFKIKANTQNVCDSKVGVCSHIGGKENCFKHANGWVAWRNYIEGASI